MADREIKWQIKEMEIFNMANMDALKEVEWQIKELVRYKEFMKIFEPRKLYLLTLSDACSLMPIQPIVESIRMERYNWEWALVGQIIAYNTRKHFKDRYNMLRSMIEGQFYGKQYPFKLVDIIGMEEIGVSDLPLYLNNNWNRTDRYRELLKGWVASDEK